MGDFDPYINIIPTTTAKDNRNYTIKNIEIEHKNIKIESPFKILEGNGINKSTSIDLTKNIKTPIFETSKYIALYKSWKTLHYLLEEEGDLTSGLNKLLGFRKDLLEFKTSLTTCSLVLSRNPFVENNFGNGRIVQPLDRDSFDSLLDHIHATSKALILSPDIIIKKNEIITIKDYLTFIDDNVNTLSKWNKKPIFVPIQINLPDKRLREILAYYKRQKYTNIWVNFNANHIGETYLGRVRTLLRVVNDSIGLNNATLYFTHIKKEINPHIKDDKVIASDILSQFFGADFIGVNREPLRIIEDSDKKIEELISKGEFKNKEEYDNTLKLHKSRIFDPDSYYYFNVDKYPYKLPFEKELLTDIKTNKLLNSALVYNEVEKAKIFVKNTKIISPYLKNKIALEENKIENRKISEYILTSGSKKGKTKQNNLFEKLGGL